MYFVLISSLLLLLLIYFLNVFKKYSERNLDFLIKYFDLKNSFTDGFRLGWEEGLPEFTQGLSEEAKSEINKINRQMYVHLGSKKVLQRLKQIYFLKIGVLTINKTANELSGSQQSNDQQIVNLFMERLATCTNSTSDLIKRETRYYINKILTIKQQYNK